ncbi:MAG: 1,4-alpha-glucan branching protein GlgB [Rhodoferax sp.]|nr:1,4-alpha-glucan branching protein GlgB [Rhodoferax sp.]
MLANSARTTMPAQRLGLKRSGVMTPNTLTPNTPNIAPRDLLDLAEGSHLRPYTVLGAHPARQAGVDGVRFAVWAPRAQAVAVAGDFNQWNGREHAMRLHTEAGVWVLFVPRLGVGDLYKFEITGGDGQRLALKADPYGLAAELRPATASRVAKLGPRKKLSPERVAANRTDAPISIYEVHPGSWRRNADGGFLNWDELADTLPAYAADLGFTHIELLPVSEHPFDGSWGYQALGLHAVSARFGSSAGLHRFVRTCHQLGLGVLLDWVPAHFPMDEHGPARFDGEALYEYSDPREGLHCDWGTLIYDFAKPQVRNFLVGNALYWLEQFGVDGLRVDAVASMLYRDYSRASGEWIPNAQGGRENLEAIGLLRQLNATLRQHAPGAMIVAEESSTFPGVSAPLEAGGLGFQFKWNMGWMNDTLQYMREDPVHRRWHHDKMTFGLVYAFSEHFVLALSHDEVVHGKGSMLGKMPGQDWQKFANLRAYYGFMWGHPGKKLLFMGQEFAQRSEWNHDTPLPWDLLQETPHQGVQKLVRDLNALYRQHPALHQLDGDAAGFAWLLSDQAELSVLAWLRRDKADAMMVVVCNFTPVPRDGFRLGVPAGARAWREALNTNAASYGGTGLGNSASSLVVQSIAAQAQAQSITLTLPPLATLFLVPQ